MGPWASWATVAAPKLPSLTPANSTCPIQTPRNSRGNSATDNTSNHRAPVSVLQPSTQCRMPLTNRDLRSLNVGVPFDFIMAILKLLGGRQDLPTPHPEHQVSKMPEKSSFFHQCRPRRDQRPTKETSGYPVTSYPCRFR